MMFDRVCFQLPLSKSDWVSLVRLLFGFPLFPPCYHFGYYFLFSLYLMSKLIVVLAVVRQTTSLCLKMKHDRLVINLFTNMV